MKQNFAIGKMSNLSAGFAKFDEHVRRELSTLFGRRALIFVLVFLVLATIFHISSNGIFLTPRNLSLLLRQGAILAIIAGGVALLMINSEIDLSIGSSVFLCGVLAAHLTATWNVPVLLAIVATIVFGMLLGLIQAFWVVVLGIPSFIATLAGLLAFRGIGLSWTNAGTVGPVPPEFIALSEGFIPLPISYTLLVAVLVAGVIFVYLQQKSMRKSRAISKQAQIPKNQAMLLFGAKILVIATPLIVLGWIVGGFQGIPMAILWVVIVITLLTILMSKTTFGRNAYLVGASRDAAQYSGIGIRKTVFSGFIIMGALYGVAGVLLTARLGSSTPGAGQFMELDAIAAAVIGGVSLRGGTGSVVGAVMGAFLLTVINNGMSILNVSSFTQLIVKAVILVIALAFDAHILRKASR